MCGAPQKRAAHNPVVIDSSQRLPRQSLARARRCGFFLPSMGVSTGCSEPPHLLPLLVVLLPAKAKQRRCHDQEKTAVMLMVAVLTAVSIASAAAFPPCTEWASFASLPQSGVHPWIARGSLPTLAGDDQRQIAIACRDFRACLTTTCKGAKS